MPDSYTEMIRQSWGEWLKYSFKASLIGILLFLSAFLALYFNEGRTINRNLALDEAEKIVIPIQIDQIKDINEGKLVYASGEAVNGEAQNDGILIDKEFDVSAANMIKLRRVVEMYQWQESEGLETEVLLGGSTETRTIYTYSKVWSSTIIDSYRFKQPEGHKNPSYIQLREQTINAESVLLGEFTLSFSLVAKINNYQHLPITTPKTFEKLPTSLRDDLKIRDEETFNQKFHLHHGSYYVTENLVSPQIGDLRIRFEIVPPATISLIAKQENSSLVSYNSHVGGEIVELFGYGSVEAKILVKRAKLFNSRFTWALRLFGFLLMFFGLLLIFNVLTVLTVFMPWLGGIVEWTSWFVAFVLSITFSLITIGVAWLSYRSVMGTTIIVVAVFFLYFLKFSGTQEVAMLVSETEVPVKDEENTNDGW